MTMIAYAVLQSRRLNRLSGKKKRAAHHLSQPIQRSAQPSPPGSNGHLRSDVRIITDGWFLKTCHHSVGQKIITLQQNRVASAIIHMNPIVPGRIVQPDIVRSVRGRLFV
ncbi:hypothetical protein IP69_11640 [Bosea sp. AAP35]|nr:hypothetical protein IP69_11640 [Bosea sp. AAP35]